MQKITPFLWFDGCAEEAVNFYTGVFGNAAVKNVTRYGEAGPGPKGSVMTATFELAGQEFIALNGGPSASPTQAVSFFVHCETQQEIDDFWRKLSEGGRTLQCGWLQDKFGFSWQVVPTILLPMLGDGDAARAGRVMRTMMTMTKLDIAALQRAYDGV